MNVKLLCAALALLCMGSLHAQWVSTHFDSASISITDDLIFDQQGNLYGADYSGDKVYKIEPNGTVSPFVSGLNAPNGLAFDSMGNLFICDNTGNAIYKADPTGTIIDTFGVTNPSGIIKHQTSDTMIFTTYAGHKLIKLAPDGSMSQWFGGLPLRGPVGLSYDDTGKLYVGNFTDRMIYQVLPDTLIYIARVPGTSGSNLGFIDYANGSLWGTNFQNHKIYRVYLGYTDSVVLYGGSTAGPDNGPLSTAKFNQPNGIIARGDSLYISEYATGKVRIIHGLSLAIEEPEPELALTISPNPVQHQLHVSIPVNGSEFQIIDMLGKMHLSGILEDRKTTINVEDLEVGLYFIKVKIGDRVLVERFNTH